MPDSTVAEIIAALNRFRFGRAVNADLPVLEAVIYRIATAGLPGIPGDTSNTDAYPKNTSAPPDIGSTPGETSDG